MKRLIPLLVALALPALLFAQNQPGGENNRYRDQPGIDNNQDWQSQGSQDNPMDSESQDRLHGQRGGDLRNSRDGSGDHQRQSLGDGGSRRHFRHGTEARRFRYRDGHRGYRHDAPLRDRRHSQGEDQST